MKQVVTGATPQTPAIRPDEVREIRYKLGQSQSEFALMIGVSLATLQAWEDGRHSPDGPAHALLRPFGARSVPLTACVIM
jgi:putative transcriptional regulator